MTDNTHLSRRDSFKAALLPLAVASLAVSAPALRAQGNGGRVVVYLSRSGNTRVLAGALSRRFDADLFEVRPRDPWPADYDEMVGWATRMREGEVGIPLAETLDTNPYETVFLGSPVWGGDLPAVMASFLRGHDLREKTVIPFLTHGGYGQGSAIETARNIIPDADWRDPFVLQGDQERDTLRSLDAWLESGVSRP